MLAEDRADYSVSPVHEFVSKVRLRVIDSLKEVKKEEREVIRQSIEKVASSETLADCCRSTLKGIAKGLES